MPAESSCPEIRSIPQDVWEVFLGLGLRGHSYSAEIIGRRVTDYVISKCSREAKLIPKAGSRRQAEKASLTLVIRSHLKAMNINDKNCMSPMPLSQNKLDGH